MEQFERVREGGREGGGERERERERTMLGWVSIPCLQITVP